MGVWEVQIPIDWKRFLNCFSSSSVTRPQSSMKLRREMICLCDLSAAWALLLPFACCRLDAASFSFSHSSIRCCLSFMLSNSKGSYFPCGSHKTLKKFWTRLSVGKPLSSHPKRLGRVVVKKKGRVRDAEIHTHWIEDVHSRHTLVTSNNIGMCIREDVPNMEMSWNSWRWRIKNWFFRAELRQ